MIFASEIVIILVADSQILLAWMETVTLGQQSTRNRRYANGNPDQ